MSEGLQFRLGVKTDPIEYRYSHGWLFRLLADEGIDLVQLGTHFELYQLPDEFFRQLRREAEDAGVRIDSIFTAHRELGGFFRTEPGYEQVARRNFERLIEIGGILGARSVGSNPGAVLRDQMGTKSAGIACYVRHMKELMQFARRHGVDWLTIEPMSCLAEPPTLPDEIAEMGQDLQEYHAKHPEQTAQAGFCTDIAHGYADREGQTHFNHVELFAATLPYLYEVHLKNTDAQFNSTFGFTAAERAKGIVDVAQFRALLVQNSSRLPVREITGYLEIGGPKLGRDYSDHRLESLLRESLQHLKATWLNSPSHSPNGDSAVQLTASAKAPPVVATESGRAESSSNGRVLISPSMMCVDLLNFESVLRRVEWVGVDMLHMDIMDAHFVPNMPLGLGLLEQLRAKTDRPLDVHLMVDDNDFFVEQLGKMGVAQISVHAESCTHLDRTLTRIRELGAKAGVAINPATPLSAIEFVLERLDYVLVMTVNPGYAGQKMTPASIRKIAECRSLLHERGVSLPIQVDGNVSFENIPPMVAAGADNLVAGTSSLFHASGSLQENMARMRKAIAKGLQLRQTRG